MSRLTIQMACGVSAGLTMMCTTILLWFTSNAPRPSYCVMVGVVQVSKAFTIEMFR
ncbi:hypothetical protein AAMO2058_001737900 [Amorphochlora amoebiformis]